VRELKLTRSADEAAETASHILGMTLVRRKQARRGRIVRRLLIEEGLDIKRELYLGLLIDRETEAARVHGQLRRRMELSKWRGNPGAILREPIHPAWGCKPSRRAQIALWLGLTEEQVTAAAPSCWRCIGIHRYGCVIGGDQPVRRDRRRQDRGTRRENDV